jgi:threonine dehydratase
VNIPPTRDTALSGLHRVRLRLDRVRDAIGEIDPVFLDTPALACSAPGCSVTLKIEPR